MATKKTAKEAPVSVPEPLPEAEQPEGGHSFTETVKRLREAQKPEGK